MKYKLVCFDVDGTLIDNLKFSWQVFHDYFETDQDKRDKVKSQFFNGEISYKEWAEHDIGMWVKKRAKKSDFFDALNQLKLMEGAMETLNELKENGVKLAIISGSLNILLEKFIPDFEEFFDDVYISHLYFDENGHLVSVDATEYDMEGKALALREIAEKGGLDLKECAFVGDYLNDVKIMEECGLGIAFNCRHDELKKIADVVVEKKDLREVLKHILES